MLFFIPNFCYTFLLQLEQWHAIFEAAKWELSAWKDMICIQGKNLASAVEETTSTRSQLNEVK